MICPHCNKDTEKVALNLCCGVIPEIKTASEIYPGAARYECPKCKKTTIPVYSSTGSTVLFAAIEWNTRTMTETLRNRE